MATNPRVRIREATPADVDAIVDVHFAAFDDDVMNQLMNPGGVSEDARQKFGSRLLQQFAAPSGTDTSPPREENFLLVAEYLPEDGPGEVVALAKWLLHREPRTEEEQSAQVFNATTERRFNLTPPFSDSNSQPRCALTSNQSAAEIHILT
jgi:hypothetical protein